MQPEVSSCVLGGGFLARLWAELLSRHGHSTILVAPKSSPSFQPPYLALTQRSLESLRHFGVNIAGVPIQEVCLYQGPSQLLQSWKARGRSCSLGHHVPTQALQQLLPPPSYQEVDALALSVSRKQRSWEIVTSNSPPFSAALCFDFTGLKSPLRLALQTPFSYLKLQSYEARLFRGRFSELRPFSSYQFKMPSSLWAFLPLDEGCHYVVQTFEPLKGRPLEEAAPVAGPLEFLAHIPPQPFAALESPFSPWGALVAGSAYLGHPNVAATFNMGLWQLRLMEPLLLEKKNELLLWEDWGKEFRSRTLFLKNMSLAASSPLREFLPFLGKSLSQILLESLS